MLKNSISLPKSGKSSDSPPTLDWK